VIFDNIEDNFYEIDSITLNGGFFDFNLEFEPDINIKIKEVIALLEESYEPINKELSVIY
jgi:hypothetical protein